MASANQVPAPHDHSKLDALVNGLRANLSTGSRLFTALKEEIHGLRQEVQRLNREILGLNEEKHDLNQEMKDLRQQIQGQKESEDKVKEIADDNARVAIRVQKKCCELKEENRGLREENRNLRNQLADLQNRRLRVKAYSSLLADGYTLSEPGQKELEEDMREISKSEEHPRDRKASKLSRPRHQRKVRYQEVPQGQTTSPPFALSTPLHNDNLSRNGGVNRSQGFADGTGNFLEEEDVGRAVVVGSDRRFSQHGAETRQGSKITAETGDTFVPETEMVRDDSDDDDVDHDHEVRLSNQGEDDGRNQRTTEDSYKDIRVPETVPLDTDLFSPIQSDNGVESSAIKRQQAEQNYAANLVPLEQSTPMQDGHSGIASKVLHSTGRSASPLLLEGKDRSRRSIPSSESQLSVDFTRTQMSPTFGGAEGKLTPDRSTSSGKPRHLGITRTNHETDKSAKLSGTTPLTLRMRKEKSAPASWMIYSRSNDSLCVPRTQKLSVESKKTSASPTCDDSGQSETSFLILQQPSQCKPESHALASLGERSSHTEERKSGSDSQSRIKRRLSDGGTDEEMNSTKRKRTVSSEMNENENNISEHLLTIQGPEKQESLPNVRGIQKSENFTAERPGGRSSSGVKPNVPYIIRTASKQNKQMVQTKLTKDSFKPSVSELGQRQREFNGGGRVYVDSQDDPYIQKALQESMTLAPVEDVQLPRHEPCGDFKVPKIPNGLHQTDRVGEDQGNVSDDVLDGNLNGSIDPAIQLSLIDDNSENDNRDNGRQQDLRRAESSRRSASADNKSASCEHQARSHGSHFEADNGDLELEFVDDSFADMFEDDKREESVDRGQEQGHEQEDGGETVLRKQIKSEPSEGEFEEDLRGKIHPGMSAEETSLARDFDNLPKKEEPPAYKFKDVVRKRDDRQKLKGFDCKECAGYYGGLGLSAEEIAQRTKNCSRHRGHYSPPSTPEHYWSIDFPDTPTCVQRGYIKEAGTGEEEAPRRRRRMGYKHNFTRTKEDGPS